MLSIICYLLLPRNFFPFTIPSRARVRKSRYWGEMLLSPIHCCDVTRPPYLLSGELCTSPLHSNRLYVYTVCCRRGGQCFSVLRTRHTDEVGDSSGKSYVTEQGHNVLLLRTRVLEHPSGGSSFLASGPANFFSCSLSFQQYSSFSHSF